MAGRFKVYKKTSSNNLVTVYLTHRDFLEDEGRRSIPVAGVVQISEKDLREDKLFCLVNLTYRYGRESDETMAYTFERTLQLINAPISIGGDNPGENQTEDDEHILGEVCTKGAPVKILRYDAEKEMEMMKVLLPERPIKPIIQATPQDVQNTASLVAECVAADGVPNEKSGIEIESKSNEVSANSEKPLSNEADEANGDGSKTENAEPENKKMTDNEGEDEKEQVETKNLTENGNISKPGEENTETIESSTALPEPDTQSTTGNTTTELQRDGNTINEHSDPVDDQNNENTKNKADKDQQNEEAEEEKSTETIDREDGSNDDKPSKSEVIPETGHNNESSQKKSQETEADGKTEDSKEPTENLNENNMESEDAKSNDNEVKSTQKADAANDELKQSENASKNVEDLVQNEIAQEGQDCEKKDGDENQTKTADDNKTENENGTPGDEEECTTATEASETSDDQTAAKETSNNGENGSKPATPPKSSDQDSNSPDSQNDIEKKEVNGQPKSGRSSVAGGSKPGTLTKSKDSSRVPTPVDAENIKENEVPAEADSNCTLSANSKPGTLTRSKEPSREPTPTNVESGRQSVVDGKVTPSPKSKPGTLAKPKERSRVPTPASNEATEPTLMNIENTPEKNDNRDESNENTVVAFTANEKEWDEAVQEITDAVEEPSSDVKTGVEQAEEAVSALEDHRMQIMTSHPLEEKIVRARRMYFLPVPSPKQLKLLTPHRQCADQKGAVLSSTNGSSCNEEKNDKTVQPPSNSSTASSPEPKKQDIKDACHDVRVLQQRLIQKLKAQNEEERCIPFSISVPATAPNSVSLVPGAQRPLSQPVGVVYELQVYAASEMSETPAKYKSTSFSVRKSQLTPHDYKGNSNSSLTSTKTFQCSPGQIDLHVTLDKTVYSHLETIEATVKLNNKSRKAVRSICCEVVQFTSISMTSTKLSRVVTTLESRDGCPVLPNYKVDRKFKLIPDVRYNRSNPGAALNGMLKDVDCQLASSTLGLTDDSLDEDLGVTVSYSVRVSLSFGSISGCVSVEHPIQIVSARSDEYKAETDESSFLEKKSNLIKKLKDVGESNKICIEEFARLRKLKSVDEPEAP